MKEYSYFIDSNIFLRTLLRDEEETFKECLLVFKKIREGKINAFTSNLVFAEINWTLLRFYKFPREKVIQGLESILKLKNLKIMDRFNPNLAIEIYEKFPVKFIDALIASNPAIFQKEAIVVSYDKDFDKLKIIRVEPKKIINK